MSHARESLSCQVRPETPDDAAQVEALNQFAFGPGRFAKAVQHLTAYPARFRLNHDFYSLPVELWLNRQLKNIVKLPKPSVDAKTMGPETASSCT